MDQSKMTFLQNVLRYSTSHADQPGSDPTPPAAEASGEASAASAPREMSPERRQWLEHALENMTMNPVDEMKKCIKYLSSPPSDETAKQVEVLETLRDWCEDMNFAIDFHKIDQYALVFALLNHEAAEMRALTCDLVGTLAQNNPYCQETLLASKVLPLVLQKLDKDPSDEVKIKALYAVSCLCRDYEPGQEKLMEGNGVDILIRTLSSPVEKLLLKCCFLFASICGSNARLKTLLTEKRLIETLIDLYRRPDLTIHEHVLSAINILVDENPRAVAQALAMKDLDFKKTLNERVQTIADDPRHNEEREMAKSILDKFFRN